MSCAGHLKFKRECPCRGCDYETEREDALFGHLYMKHRKADIVTALLKTEKQRKEKAIVQHYPLCPRCGSRNTTSHRRTCSHGQKCLDCGYIWCSYYSQMSDKERLLRKRFFLERGVKEEPGAYYLWSGVKDE